eukprot:CAMPEP_0119308018 /NCGR_PEP_ID=MMETSP1333-20130426/8355_1 /TAXON_ID=418940 /ORGANISM="Scyphosphaera apsteinii, Strain RCC1455" /LENGTH=245 /DNA_ID=CAMNT_0007311699 /DNA_START=77 /DNA_END=814 /DNA_ORIENTATION=+
MMPAKSRQATAGRKCVFGADGGDDGSFVRDGQSSIDADVVSPVSFVQGWLQQQWQDIMQLWADPEESEAAKRVTSELCRPDGWTIQCDIGAAVARAAGGTGTLARQSSSAEIRLDLRVALDLDAGYEPPQGSVRLLSSSRLLNSSRGFWKVDATDEEDMPTALQMRLSCKDIEVSGETLVPAGALYFNALIDQSNSAGAASAVRLSRGQLTVKEDLGVNLGLFNPRGILAEFKLIGTFRATAADA